MKGLISVFTVLRQNHPMKNSVRNSPFSLVVIMLEAEKSS